jgi:hypothetical protein
MRKSIFKIDFRVRRFVEIFPTALSTFGFIAEGDEQLMQVFLERV